MPEAASALRQPYSGGAGAGMLTNLESQLKQQNAADKLDRVLAEIPACARPGLFRWQDPTTDCRHPCGAQRPDRRRAG